MPGSRRWPYKTVDEIGSTLGTRIGYMKDVTSYHGRRRNNFDLGRELGERLKTDEPLHHNSVSQWMRDIAVPNLDTLHALADIFKCDPGWLAFGSYSTAEDGLSDEGRSQLASRRPHLPSGSVVARRATRADFLAAAKRPGKKRKPKRA